MSAPPYMKLYVADYLGDTYTLNVVEHGAYLLLLMGMWRAGGKLPADDAKLAKIACCTPEQWAEIRATVLAFFRRRGSLLTHKRVTKEIAKYRNTSGARSEAGKLGAAKKARKNNNEAEAIASDAESNCTHNQNQNQNQNKDGVVVGAREPDLRVIESDWPDGDIARRLVELIGSPWLDPSKSPGLVTTAGRLAAWRRDGASWQHDVIPVVTGLCARRRSPIATWKFFDEAVARSISDNRAALSIPPATDRGSISHDRNHGSAFSDNLARAYAGSEIALGARRG